MAKKARKQRRETAPFPRSFTHIREPDVAAGMLINFTTTPTLPQVAAVKKLMQRNAKALGFVNVRTLVDASTRAELLTLWRGRHEDDVIGAINYHLRRDGVITIYEIVTDENLRQMRIGSRMIEVLEAWGEKRGVVAIKLKCPVDNESNKFYQRVGFRLVGTERGKKRALCVWRKETWSGLAGYTTGKRYKWLCGLTRT